MDSGKPFTNFSLAMVGNLKIGDKVLGERIPYRGKKGKIKKFLPSMTEERSKVVVSFKWWRRNKIFSREEFFQHFKVLEPKPKQNFLEEFLLGDDVYAVMVFSFVGLAVYLGLCLLAISFRPESGVLGAVVSIVGSLIVIGGLVGLYNWLQQYKKRKRRI